MSKNQAISSVLHKSGLYIKKYSPAVAIGASTIACIMGANALNRRQQVALTSAYALDQNSYKEYKDNM